MIIIHGIEHLLWYGDTPVATFAGFFQIVVMTTVAGLVVGLIHQPMPTEAVDVFGAIPVGDISMTHVVGAVLDRSAALSKPCSGGLILAVVHVEKSLG